MKISNKLFLTFLLVTVFQFAFSRTIFAQSETEAEEETRNKCELCETYRKSEDRESYEAESCRIFESICNKFVFDHNGPVIMGTNDTMAIESTNTNQLVLEVNEETPLLIFIDGFEKTSYNVTPRVTILNAKKKVVKTLKTTTFQEYTFGKGKKVNVGKVQSIEKLDNSKRILATNIKMPKIEGKTAYIKVEFVKMSKKTKKTIIVETLMKKAILK